jgi:hypothetical protein
VRGAALPLIPGHLDWGVKNARFHGERISVVYDWDSLFAASEAEVVGRAAAQFAAQWQTGASPTVTSEEASAFVSEYEAARCRALSRAEREVARASAEYLIAEIARLEFGAGASERPFLELCRSLGGRLYIP